MVKVFLVAAGFSLRLIDGKWTQPEGCGYLSMNNAGYVCL
jgi:hypothetical protein